MSSTARKPTSRTSSRYQEFFPPLALARLQRSLKEYSGMGSAQPDLAELTFSAGYADQAHMCREFRELADTPRKPC